MKLSIEKQKNISRVYKDEDEADKIPEGLETVDRLIIESTKVMVPKAKQDILRGTGTIELLIKITHTFAQANLKEKSYDKIHKFVAEILVFLSYAIYKNQENQNMTLKELPLLNELIFSTQSSFEGLMLAKSFIHDNKKVLLSESLCRDMIRLMCIIENQISQASKKIMIFNILSEFCQYKGNPIKRNQNTIIMNLIDQGENKITKKLSVINYKTIFANFSNKMDSLEFAKNATPIICLPLDIKLILSVITLLNKCNEGDNNYVANISITTITLESVNIWMKAFLPVPIKLIILRYIYNAYLGEGLALSDADKLDLLILFKSLSSDLENIEDLNILGAESSKDYLLVTHDNFIRATDNDQDYIGLFLDSCKKLFIMAMLHSEEKSIARESEAFSSTINSVLNNLAPSSMRDLNRQKMEDFTALINENYVRLFDAAYKKRKSGMGMAMTIKTFKSGNLGIGTDLYGMEKSMNEFRSNSTFEVFNYLLKKYNESSYFKHDTDSELNHLMELIRDAEKNKELMQGTMPLSIHTLCKCIIEYLIIAEEDSSESQQRCRTCSPRHSHPKQNSRDLQN